MKNIYLYGIDNVKGGIENYCLTLVKGIKEKDSSINFHIITEYDDFTFKNIFLDKLNCKYTVIPKKKKHPFKYVKAILALLNDADENDLLQINLMSYKNFLVLHAAKKAKIKTLIVGHATRTNNFISNFIHKFFRLFYKKFGVKIANNQNVKNHMFGKNCKNCKIIEFGFDSTKCVFNNEKRNEIRTLYNIQKDEFVIGQVGRISKAKNQAFSLKIMKNLQSCKNIKLLVFGFDKKNKFSLYLEKHNIKNVFYCGEINNINEIYNAFDLFIFPSLFESAGYALYESLSNGCPSIASNNVPLDGIASNILQICKLDLNEWITKIRECYEAKKVRSGSKLIIRTINEQISDYYNLYLNYLNNL